MTNEAYVGTLLSALELLTDSLNNQRKTRFIESTIKAFFEQESVSRTDLEGIAFQLFGDEAPTAKTLDKWVQDFIGIYEQEISIIWSQINTDGLKHRPRLQRHTPSEGGAKNQTTYQITDEWPETVTTSQPTKSSSLEPPNEALYRRVALTKIPLLAKVGLRLSTKSRKFFIVTVLLFLVIPVVTILLTVFLFPNQPLIQFPVALASGLVFIPAWKLKRLAINKRLVDIPISSSTPVLYEIAFKANNEITDYENAEHYFRASVIEGDCPDCLKTLNIKSSLYIESKGIWDEKIVGTCRVMPTKHKWVL